MSDLMDKGSWTFAVVAVLVVSMGFYVSVNTVLDASYRIPGFSEFYDYSYREIEDPAQERAAAERATAEYERANSARARIPLIGDRFFSFFSFDPYRFYHPVLLLSIFYVPSAILLMSIFGSLGSFGLIIRRDYGTLAICTLSAWAAAHLPFAVLGFAFSFLNAGPPVFLALWVASSVLFGVFMVFALRTVFGAHYGVAVLVVALSWLSLSAGMYIFQYVSPWMFSPFLIMMVVLHFGGYLGGEVRGFGNAMRQKQNLKRFLQNATVNPKDADAHVQLALIYLQRRQEEKAIEHLTKALEIDEVEIDANYEMGRIERTKGNLQKALDHFAVVLEQNDKHALSEVWREVGETYFTAGMLDQAHDALEKFTIRRSADVEGLYYFGKVLKAQGKTDQAREIFQQAVQSANSSPDFSRRGTKHWSRLAQKEI